MGTTETKVSPLTEDKLAEIELPEYETTYVKPQPKYTTGEGVTDKDGNKQTGRVFSASGPKAQLVAKYLVHGGYTRQEIADFVGCSVSRVGEVIWALDASNVEYPEILRRRPAAKPEPKEAASDVPESTPTESTEDETTEDEVESA